MNFQEGFREALPYWLNQAFSTTQDRVERAVQVDQVRAEPRGLRLSLLSLRTEAICSECSSQLQPLQSGAVPIKHSSSAVDLVACIQPICHLWEQLFWPDPEEAFMLMVKLTEVLGCAVSAPPNEGYATNQLRFVCCRTCARLW